jgi:hypothetical protein
MNTTSHRVALSAALFFVAAVPSCVSPERALTPSARLEQQDARTANTEGMNNGDGTVTVFTTQGSFTLDPANNVLTFPNGVRAEVTPELSEKLATAFQSIADNPAGQLQTQLEAQDNCWQQDLCAVRPKAPTRARENKPSVDQRVQLRFAKDENAPSTRPRVLDKPTPRRRGAPRSALYGDSFCGDIAQTIYDQTNVWRSSKELIQNKLNWLSTELVAHMYSDFYGYIIGGTIIPHVAFEAVMAYTLSSLEVGLMTHLSSTMQLGILASLYSTYGCWNPEHGNWYSGGFNLSGLPGWTCRPVPVEMSFDWGITWTTYIATYCEYKK